VSTYLTNPLHDRAVILSGTDTDLNSSVNFNLITDSSIEGITDREIPQRKRVKFPCEPALVPAVGSDYTSNQYVDLNSSAVGVGPLSVLKKRVTHTDKDSWVSGTQQSKFVELGTTHNSNRDDANSSGTQQIKFVELGTTHISTYDDANIIQSSNKILDNRKGVRNNKSTRVLRSNTKLVIEPSSNNFLLTSL
jgi:hypothetical protein